MQQDVREQMVSAMWDLGKVMFTTESFCKCIWFWLDFERFLQIPEVSRAFSIIRWDYFKDVFVENLSSAAPVPGVAVLGACAVAAVAAQLGA